MRAPSKLVALVGVSLSLSAVASAAEGLPDVEVSWRKTQALLILHPPEGEHVALDAPIHGWVEVDDRLLEIGGLGAAVQDGLGLVLPTQDVHALNGELRLSLCEDGGTLCRLVDVGFSGALSGRRGRTQLAVHAPAPDPQEGPELQGSHPNLTPAQAFEQAAAQDQLVLLDFSAVWCPPCNLLAAEVLHDAENVEDLASFAVAEIDADRRSSWDIKDRYVVGGYPTLVVTRADGTELDRMVGYPGEAELLRWLRLTQRQLTPLDELVGAELTAEQAGHAALRLLRADRDDDARALLESATGPAAAQARFTLDPNEDDLLLLCDQAADTALEWVWPVLGMELSDQAKARLTDMLARRVLVESPLAASDLLYLLASLGEESQAASLYAASAALLSGQLNGDPMLDRGHYYSLATLYERAGAPEQALTLLLEASRTFPHEFTFHYSIAGLLLRLERHEEAVPYALAAQALGYGDMRLRATARLARIQHGMGLQEEALAGIDGVLQAFEAPEEQVQVRTHRYIAQLEELREELSAVSPRP